MGRIARFACLLSLVVVALAKNIYGQVSNTWSSANQMSEARTGAAAVLLRDGRVLITGGSDASGLPMASAEYFSPTTGTFSPAPAMNVARANHAAILLTDGEVLVTGGATTGGAYSDTAEVYNPATQQWTLLNSSLGTGRTGHAMALLPDGNVLIAGGESTSGPVAALQLFNTADHTITSIGSLITARTDAAAAATPDGRVLIAGGTDSDNNILASTEIFVYAPSTLTGSISAGPAMSYARSAATATSTYDGVAIIGGYNVQNGTQTDLGTAEIFSQWTNAFRVVSGATPRSGHFAVRLPANGSVLAMGGTGGQAVDLLQPWANNTAGAFVAAASSQSSHSGGFAASAGLGALLAAGGQGSAAGTAELYWFPTISTDQPDYAPGTQVTMTGTGFQPGETVDLHLHEWVNQATTDAPDYKVTALSDGTFSFNGYAPTTTDIGARYHLTAVGETSALQAQTIFTDAAPYALTIQVNPAGGSPNANSVKAGTTNGGSDVIGACTSGVGCSGSESTNNVNLYITATSGTGYAFSSWAFASGSTPTSCDSNPSPNICVIKSSNNKSATVTANFNVVTSTTKFTNLTVSQSISYGTSSITLSGNLTGSPVNPPSGSAVSITINGVTTNTTTTDATGDFSASVTTSALSASAVPYTITYSYAATTNFNSTSDTSTTLTVNQMQVTLSAGSYSGTYDGSTHALSACTSSAPSFVTCANSPTGPVGPDATASPQTVTPSPNYVQGDSADYTLTSNNGSWSIAPLAVTLSAGSYSGAYDGSTHALSACSSSSALLSCTNNPAGPVGPDVVSTPVTVSPVPAYGSAVAADFSITSNSGSWSIAPLGVTLSAGSYSGIYDGSTHALSACTSTSSSLVTCTNSPAGPVGPDVSSGAQTVTPIPNYAKGNAGDYAFTSNNGSWSITPLAATLTGGSYSAVYDGNSHALSTCTSSSTLLSCTNNPVGPVGPDVVSTPVPVSPVPVYGSAVAADFAITSNNGSWSITPLPVTLHAGSYSGTYDANTHALSACTSNESSFVTCSNNPVGPVGPGVGSGSVSPTPSYPKGIPADYDLTSQNGSWSITTAAISATLTAHDRTYDGTTSEPNNNMSCSLVGVFAADTGNISCTPSDGTFASADVGTWTVSATVTIGGGAAGNYTLGAAGTALTSTSATASASITPLALALTAGGYTGIYDGSTHALSGCTSSAPAFVTCTNNPAGPVGPDAVATPQTVTPTPKYVQGNSGDYTITNNNSSWSITPLAVTLTGGSYSGVFDGNSHALSTCTSSSPLLTCTNNPAGPVGPDVISAPVPVSPVPAYGSAIAADFLITSNNGSWSITPLAVTISAGSYNGIYDGNTHALSACTSTAPAFLTCANDPAGPVGPDAVASPQTVTPTPKYVQGSAGDYTLTSNNGSWSITPLAVTLTAGSYSGAYDGTSHALTSCTSSSPLFVTCTNDPVGPEKNAGTGTVTPVLSIIQGISGDYTITDKNGSWNITPVPLTITSDSKSMIIDGTLPTFTATYSGFVGGEGPTALTGTLNCTAGTNGQSIGLFTITCSGQTSTNYNIVYNNTGKLTVTYAAAGGVCDGDAGHQILQPIMSGSVFKSNSTTPAKFRVCDAKGVSIGTPGVVSSFVLVGVTNGTVTTADETVGSTTPDAAFRWDPTGQQWIFNISNSSLATSFGTNKTFTFLITLNDGTTIPFQYGLR